jgi:hypothetical protein
MSSQGFSTVLAVLGLVVLIPVILLSFHGISLSTRKHQIESQIAGLHISATPQSEQCGGDGVDSNPWCDYKYAVPMTTIEKALAQGGYTLSGSNNFQANTETTFVGGNPKMSFKVSSFNGLTTLYGERSQ